MPRTADSRTCFLITPLGEARSVVRSRADAVGAFLVPILAAHGLQLSRGDLLGGEGDILRQVIDALLDSAVVVADVSGGNPNVMYELGMADAFVKPVLRVVEDPSALPFNFRNARTISLPSLPSGALDPDSLPAVGEGVHAFLAKALAWDSATRPTAIAEALRERSRGWGESSFAMLGGFRLANGWDGIRKALAAVGADVETWDSARHPVSRPQFRVALVGALVSENAALVLDFGDWTEDEIYDYVADLVDLLVDCRSPYAVHADAIRLRVEPGERLPRRVR